MDDRQFDDLSRRIGGSPLSRLPRRGLIAALGGATVASVLHLDDDAEAKKKKNKNKNKKCKNEGQKCDKQKCKKKDKKCCCNNLKCKNDVCEGKGGSCPTKVTFQNTFANTGAGATTNPWGITYDSTGYVYIADQGNSRIKIYYADGSNFSQFGTTGDGGSSFQTPQGIAYQSGNNRLVISDRGQPNADPEWKLRRFQLGGSVANNIGVSGLSQPVGVAVDSNDRIWAVDNTNPGEIYLFNSSGSELASWSPSGSGQLDGPQGIAVYRDSQDGGTYVYVADSNNDRVVKFEYTSNSSSGLVYVTAAGSSGSGSNGFNTPVDIAIDTCGNLWVTDQINNRVQVLDKNLNFKTRFTASMNRPAGIAISGDTLYVVNYVGNSAQRFSLSNG